MGHQHLILAYIATWIILIGYVGFLSLTARRLKREVEELKKGQKVKGKSENLASA